jgi:hypothetical protein
LIRVSPELVCPLGYIVDVGLHVILDP